MADNQIRGQMELAPAGDVPDSNQVMPAVAIFFVQNGQTFNLNAFIEQSQAGGTALMGLIEALTERVEALETP